MGKTERKREKDGMDREREGGKKIREREEGRGKRKEISLIFCFTF